MAFVCTIDPDVDQITMVHRGNSHLLILPIGYDDSEDKSYSFLIVLDPMPGGDLDLSFCLVEYDGQTDSEYTYWSGRDVAKFINRDDRARILERLLSAIRLLLNEIQPLKVHMCTLDAHPPEKAQRKNFLIARVFELCGYEVRTADPYYGQQVWWMERKTPTTN